MDSKNAPPSAEEDNFREHFGSFYNDGSVYDDYAPAYRYGSTMRDDSRFAQRHWDDAEPELRDNWESSNPSSWDKFKAAVRHGWERMTR